ncbi:hypothetical protein RB195_003980 [Necator americanus]|uniref:Uncharacterized protein n=1 Tax=Necator americanus TaxID=51031 RepID=A0ABR1DTT9_NECAM
MTKLVVLLGLLTLVSTQQVENCQMTQFNHCNAALQQFWDIDTTNIWNDVNQLNQALISLMRPPYGINNYVTICNGFANFYSCLGPENIYFCLGLVGQVGMGKSPQDAYAYQGLMADWQFKCGTGFFAVYESLTFTLQEQCYCRFWERMQIRSKPDEFVWDHLSQRSMPSHEPRRRSMVWL